MMAREVKMGSSTYPWDVWADVLKPLSGTESMAQYSNQYAGETAVSTEN